MGNAVPMSTAAGKMATTDAWMTPEVRHPAA